MRTTLAIVGPLGVALDTGGYLVIDGVDHTRLVLSSARRSSRSGDYFVLSGSAKYLRQRGQTRRLTGLRVTRLR